MSLYPVQLWTSANDGPCLLTNTESLVLCFFLFFTDELVVVPRSCLLSLSGRDDAETHHRN